MSKFNTEDRCVDDITNLSAVLDSDLKVLKDIDALIEIERDHTLDYLKKNII